MLIVGEQEQDNDQVSLRTRSGDKRNGIPREEFSQILQEKVENKELV
jgi:threonyl-tRNA synthetase